MAMSKIKVPFVNLAAAYRNDALAITAAIDEIGNSGQYILGTKVKNFEKEFAEFIGTKYAIGVANGSDALFLIMKALGIGPGDEVITQPNSFIASAWTIVATGATPVFCEVDETLGLDPEHLLKLITPRTKAVMPVHLTGNPTKIDAIQEVLTGTGIEVIEDAAQAVGAKFNGKRVGSFGIAAMFSLHPLKNLGVLGDGGVITTDSEEIYAKIIKLRNHGLIDRDHCEIWGYNSRLDELQAAIGSIRLAKLDDNTSRVRQIAGKYSAGLSDLVTLPKSYLGSEPVFHNYIIHTENRDGLQSFLHGIGVETKIHYPVPIHLQECAENLGYKVGSFPISEYQSTNSLSLPIYPELTDEQVEIVISGIKRFFKTDL
jgi:dTDP-4-amino-4,6-dideoxygalactose transaminase